MAFSFRAADKVPGGPDPFLPRKMLFIFASC